MNKLARIPDLKLSPLLSQSEIEIVICKEGKKIKDLKRSEVKVFLSTLIVKTYQDCGQTAVEKDIELSVNEVLIDVLNYAGGFTIAQITHAFKLGRLGEFGEWYGLNSNTFQKWIRGYMGYSKRFDANKKQEAYLKELNKPKEPTAEEKKEFIKQVCLKAFEDFKEKGFVIDAGNASFNYLWNNRIISFTSQRTTEFKLKALEVVKLEKVAKMDNPELRKEIKKSLAEIEKKMLEHNEVLIEAKKIALNTFFKELMETETELKDLLNG